MTSAERWVDGGAVAIKKVFTADCPERKYVENTKTQPDGPKAHTALIRTGTPYALML